MMNFSFLNYVWEICKVSKECHCGPSEAFDRFHADVRAGEAKEYNTGNALNDFNFIEVNKLYNSMNSEERNNAIDEWVEFIRGKENRERWFTLTSLYRAGDRETFDALVNSAR